MIVAPPIPYHLMNETATITPATVTAESNGHPDSAWSSGTVTVNCSLQPASAGESLQYGRDTGFDIYNLFLAPVDTSGTAVTLTGVQFKTARIVVTAQSGESLTLRTVGTARDMINLGTVMQLTVEREV